MTAFLSLDAITKRYGGVAALDAVSIDIARGDFVTLLGPSGSGKSTALMAIAGFVTPDAGQILFEGADITHLPPEKRNFGVVFQGYALFPHMSVSENIAYPLSVRGESKAAATDKIRRVLDLVQLSGFADRKPSMLSGGQQQRVAIARALVYEPPILLLDEPMSALDRKLRGELQAELKALHERLGATFVNVTHDQDEALTLSTNVVVLSRGQVMQQGSPAEIYDQPLSDFVADFIGNANLIRISHIVASDDVSRGQAAGAPIDFQPRHPISGDSALLAIRPEALSLGTSAYPGANSLSGIVRSAARSGAVVRVSLEVAGIGVLNIVQPWRGATPPCAGDTASVAWRIDDILHVLPVMRER